MKSKHFSYFGGKGWLVDWLQPIMDRCNHYNDPFFGGGAVLLSQSPSKFSTEVVGDVNGLLVNFYRAVKSDAKGLIELMDKNLASDADLEASMVACINDHRNADFQAKLIESMDWYDLDAARHYYYYMRCGFPNGFGSIEQGDISETKLSCNVARTNPFSIGSENGERGYTGMLNKVSKRLQNVAVKRCTWNDSLYDVESRIGNANWTNVAPKSYGSFENDNLFLFLDPPYGARAGTKDRDDEHYGMIFDNEKFETKVAEMANIPGVAIVLCGNKERQLLNKEDWYVHEKFREDKFRQKSHVGMDEQRKDAVREFIYTNSLAESFLNESQQGLFHDIK